MENIYNIDARNGFMPTHNVNWTETRLQQEISECEERIAMIGQTDDPELLLTKTYLENVLERRKKILAALRYPK
ncbi:MAG: hypothetical protein WC383_13185 [Gammaproteobacteria bacterium]